MIKIVGKFTAETLFKVESGGKIIADGIEFDGAEAKRIVDADTSGSVSIRNSKFTGRFAELGSAMNGASVDMSGASVRNISRQIGAISPEILSQRLSEALEIDVSTETASKIIEIFSSAKDLSALEEQAKKAGLWEWLGRAGGLAGLIQGIASIWG